MKRTITLEIDDDCPISSTVTQTDASGTTQLTAQQIIDLAKDVEFLGNSLVSIEAGRALQKGDFCMLQAGGTFHYLYVNAIDLKGGQAEVSYADKDGVRTGRAGVVHEIQKLKLKHREADSSHTPAAVTSARRPSMRP